MALTCTQELQKWHRTSIFEKKKAKAKAASHIRLKYFSTLRKAIYHKKSTKKVVIYSSELKTTREVVEGEIVTDWKKAPNLAHKLSTIWKTNLVWVPRDPIIRGWGVTGNSFCDKLC